jgi:DNA modification methylase
MSEVLVRQSKLVNIDKLKESKINVKIHPQEQIDGLAKIIKKYGFINPIVINADYGIEAGHGRILAARQLKMKKVPCVFLDDLSKKDLKAFMIMENKIAESAWDKENLTKVLSEIPTFDFESFNMDFSDFVPVEIKEETQPVPEPPKTPEAKLGDIYQLGRHVIICGNCSEQESFDKLLKNKTVDQLLTDPPYGVDYANKNKFLNTIGKANHIETPIEGDNIENYTQVYEGFLKTVRFSEYNTVYIFMSGKELHSLRQALINQVITPSDYLVWAKNNHVLGRKDYNSKHEFVLYGWKGKHKFYGPHRTTLLEYDKPHVNDLHPTMKPIELLSQLIQDGSKKDMLVYDPFLGSGSTIIACEQTNRTCYGMEIDPAYVDVTIKRWENYTGKKAKKLN